MYNPPSHTMVRLARLIRCLNLRVYMANSLHAHIDILGTTHAMHATQ